jgi:hypothetical protein
MHALFSCRCQDIGGMCLIRTGARALIFCTGVYLEHVVLEYVVNVHCGKDQVSACFLGFSAFLVVPDFVPFNV